MLLYVCVKDKTLRTRCCHVWTPGGEAFDLLHLWRPLVHFSSVVPKNTLLEKSLIHLYFKISNVSCLTFTNSLRIYIYPESQNLTNTC